MRERSFPFPISEDDLYNIPELTGNGMMGVAFCAHGIARSWMYADYLTKQGTKSVFFEGGFEKLNEMPKPTLEIAIDNFLNIPERWAVLTDSEIRKYAHILHKLGVSLVRDNYCLLYTSPSPRD